MVDQILSTLLLGLMLAWPAAGVTDPELDDLYQSFSSSSGWTAVGMIRDPSPEGYLARNVPDVIYRGRGANPDPSSAQRHLAEVFGVPLDVASPLLEGVLRFWRAAHPEDPEVDTARQSMEDRLAAEEALELAVSFAPASLDVATELAFFYDYWAAQESQADAGKLLSLILEGPPGLMDQLRKRSGFASREQVMALYLERDPGHPVALARAVKPGFLFLAEAASQIAALDALAARELDQPKLRELWSSKLVAKLLDAGMVEQAVAIFDHLPEVVQARWLRGERPEIQATVAPFTVTERLPDLRHRLAVVFALVGREQASAAILSTLGEPDDPLMTPDQKARRRLGLELLQTWLMKSSEDPFPLFLRVLGIKRDDESFAIGTRADPEVLLLSARLAWRAGYPEIERYHLTGFLASAETWGHLYNELPDEVRQRALFLEQQQEAVFDELRQTSRHSAWPYPIGTARLVVPELDAGLPAWARPRRREPHPEAHEILRAPEPQRSSERPLPKRLRVDLESQALIDWAFAGEELVALVLGPDLNGSSQRAYWLWRSVDGARSWQKPLFTGLILRRPYELRVDAGLRRLGSGRWRLQADLWERIAIWEWHRQSLVELELVVAELARDTDDDGLTDLVERRFGIDPEQEDTDGDGLLDATDPLPQVPLRFGDSAAGRALDAIMDELLAPWMSTGASFQVDDQVLEQAVFIAAGDLPWEGVDPRARVILVDETRHPAAGVLRHNGVVNKTISLFAVNRAENAGVLLSEHIYKGLEEIEGAWRFSEDGYYVTLCLAAMPQW